MFGILCKTDAEMPDDDDRCHIRNAEKLQDELIRKMTPGRRLEIARNLYEMAWNLKRAGLRTQHPEWSEQQIAAKLRRVFLTGYAGA